MTMRFFRRHVSVFVHFSMFQSSLITPVSVLPSIGRIFELSMRTEANAAGSIQARSPP